MDRQILLLEFGDGRSLLVSAGTSQGESGRNKSNYNNNNLSRELEERESHPTITASRESRLLKSEIDSFFQAKIGLPAKKMILLKSKLKTTPKPTPAEDEEEESESEEVGLHDIFYLSYFEKNRKEIVYLDLSSV